MDHVPPNDPAGTPARNGRPRAPRRTTDEGVAPPRGSILATVEPAGDNPLLAPRPLAPAPAREERASLPSPEPGICAVSGDTDPEGAPDLPGLDLAGEPQEQRLPLKKQLLLRYKSLWAANRLEAELDRRIDVAIDAIRTRPDPRALSMGTHSSKGGVGKSHEGKLMAHALALDDRLSVAVLDANMDHSNLAETLGDRNPRTLADVLEHEAAIRRGGHARLKSFATIRHGVAYFLAPELPGQLAEMDPVALTRAYDLIATHFDVVVVDNSISFRDPLTHWSLQTVDHICYVATPQISVMRKVLGQVLYVTGRIPGHDYARDQRAKLELIADAWRRSTRAEDGLPTDPPGTRDPRDVSVVVNKVGERGPGRDPVSLEKVRAAVPAINIVAPFPYSTDTADKVESGDLRLDELPSGDRLAAKQSLASILERLADRASCR